MKRAILALVGAALVAAGSARAQPATVEAVQYPAWLERGGRAVPLVPGIALQPADRLRTGGNARVQLKLAEGSAVKLGENAQFVIERAESRGIFRASLSVLAGAFRFTTNALARSQRRDISIKVKNVTAGIRGTDVWGKAGDARDLVCLLEGKITVGAEGHPTVALGEPLDFYQKAAGRAPEVAKVDRAQIEQWSRETDIAPGGGAARVGGRWRVVAAVVRSRDAALALSRELRGRGFPTEVGPREADFAVFVPGLPDEAAARGLMANLRGIPGVTLPLVMPSP